MVFPSKLHIIMARISKLSCFDYCALSNDDNNNNNNNDNNNISKVFVDPIPSVVTALWATFGELLKMELLQNSCFDLMETLQGTE